VTLAPQIEPLPGWEQFLWLRAGFSTRPGGASTVYSEERVGELNLGATPEDDPRAVSANREALLHAVAGTASMELATVRQTHSAVLHVIAPEHEPLATPDGKATLVGDALATSVPGVLLGIQTADCVPVLVADTRNRAVAAFHAGWRGTAARIVEHGIATMQGEFGSDPADLIAAIGPSIGPCCYAVSEDLRKEFAAQFSYAPELFSLRDGSQLHLDLWTANRRQLLDAGLSPEAITVLGECSACARLGNGKRKYFSYRSEKGRTGRMMGVIGIAPL